MRPATSHPKYGAFPVPRLAYWLPARRHTSEIIRLGHYSRLHREPVDLPPAPGRLPSRRRCPKRGRPRIVPPPVPSTLERYRPETCRTRTLPYGTRNTVALHIALHHRTQYAYDRAVRLSPHVVRLRPAPHSRTPILGYSLRVRPEPHFLNWQQDPFGNYEARLVFPEPTREFAVEVDLLADLVVINPFDFFLEEAAERFPFEYAKPLARDLVLYRERAKTGRAFDEFVERIRTKDARPGRRAVDVLVDINRRVRDRLRYDIRMDPGVFTPDETLTRGHGACRDFAWLLVQVLRSLGLAARFVSGYSIQLVADQKPVVGPTGVDRDCTDLHAWAEVFLPGAGWIGLDATSGLMAGEGHIPLACTPDFATAAPISGTVAWDRTRDADKLGEDFSFSMSVQRIVETPRVTLPYSETAWSAIQALGEKVDASLAAEDVRLTMGGEPTFVAVDDPDGDEWNTEADGPTKRRHATELIRRLQARRWPGALLHEGQGKWYPGEPLPRWALSCYYRKDGIAIWKDADRFAPSGPGADGEADARALLSAIAERLGVGEQYVIPAYEDIWYYLWRERRLPTNVDPLASHLDDEQERERFARLFDQGLSTIVGYALPLRGVPGAAESGWESGPWLFRRERMYLIPGDSPMGFRLPLDSLPWAGEYASDEVEYEVDPLAPRGALPGRAALGRPRPRGQSPYGARASVSTGERAADARFGPVRRGNDEDVPRRGDSVSGMAGVVRSALCVQPREGVLHVFMPPLCRVEEYVDLCAAIEEIAAAQDKRVRIEGYHPPHDPRLGKLSVTPDPGVIEVNVPPVDRWSDLVADTETLYQTARECGLSAEKFMMDGRHAGTGGGNHIVIGGPTAADSPLLRRPDLLRSLVGFWLNHPSLSYLFSGLFVGPTSQAPRVDEARLDSLDELEIAFREMSRRTQNQPPPPPWLVDRLLRHLLVDVTGNTHRAEFCIDKLFSPDSVAGRLGLVELRSFEMPPHPRMSVTQQLLVRALVASFWKTPYEVPLVRFGTDLHDRFALPHFVWSDFEDVLDSLSRTGFSFDPQWFAPHFEFRFPRIGEIQAAPGITLELREAIEPWPVLGEEPGAGGTVRFVDSSLERLQVKVRGLVGGRHSVTCNGAQVPLHPTGPNGEFVAGIRYRAWQPPSALHPTIAPHTPLVFDLFDHWNDRSVAGGTYHVAHPGGRAFDRLPRNAAEAESRRASRFFAFGHTPGRFTPSTPPAPARCPMTLDLRR